MSNVDDTFDEPLDEQPLPDRAKDLSRNPAVHSQLLRIFKDVEAGFVDQNERANDISDYWDIYNCKLGAKQFYTGNSRIFVPIIHNAINARQTRFANQLFPPSGRFVEVISEDGTNPLATTALMEHYVRKAKLRTKVMPPLLRNGDVEGQYTVYVSWCERKRNVVWKTKKPAQMADGISIPDTDIDDIQQEAISDAYPEVEVIADTDFLTLPATCDSPEEALDSGGSVTVLRRWSKAKVRRMVAEGLIDKKEGELLIGRMSYQQNSMRYDKSKEMTDAAGVKSNESGVKYGLVYETWAMVKLGKEWRLCQSFYGGEECVLGARLNPYWSDRLPILSVPVEKINGSFKGMSKIKFCALEQYGANDAINMGMDSAAYSLLPIVMTDPEKNPRVGSMVLAQAAIWETSPQDTQFAEFPQLWTNALQIVQAAAAEIATTLAVSPAAITQQASGKKLSQADVANEQQVDMSTTADAVTVVSELLDGVLIRFAEMDHQYRKDSVTVKKFGEMGVRAVMEKIPPLQMDNLYQFRWFGVEAAQNAQQIQQQIAATNVLRGIPPQSYPGYRLNLQPVIAQLVENTFGPRLAPLIFEDLRSQLSLDPMFENELLGESIDLAVNPSDNDMQHMQAHMPLMAAGDPSGVVRVHLERHKMAMEQKTAAAMQAGQLGGGAPGEPGIPGGGVGGQPQPGVAGPPRIGAPPGGPRPNGQGPPGMIHADNMVDPRMMPR